MDYVIRKIFDLKSYLIFSKSLNYRIAPIACYNYSSMNIFTVWNTYNLYNMVLGLWGKVLLFKEERSSETFC